MTRGREARGSRGGWLVTFEGIEGCGKSTQVRLLAEWLRERGPAPLVTHEPGGTELGTRLRRLLLAPAERALTPEAELLLYAADRAQHVVEVIRPALERGALVLCDRYLDATTAYQGHGRGIPLETIRRLHRLPPLDLLPDRTLVLDLEPEPALARARRRNRQRGISGSEGRFEDERLAFHRRVREGYLAIAASEPERVRVVPADGDVGEVQDRVRDALADVLAAAGATP